MLLTNLLDQTSQGAKIILNLNYADTHLICKKIKPLGNKPLLKIILTIGWANISKNKDKCYFNLRQPTLTLFIVRLRFRGILFLSHKFPTQSRENNLYANLYLIILSLKNYTQLLTLQGYQYSAKTLQANRLQKQQHKLHKLSIKKAPSMYIQIGLRKNRTLHKPFYFYSHHTKLCKSESKNCLKLKTKLAKTLYEAIFKIKRFTKHNNNIPFNVYRMSGNSRGNNHQQEREQGTGASAEEIMKQDLHGSCRTKLQETIIEVLSSDSDELSELEEKLYLGIMKEYNKRNEAKDSKENTEIIENRRSSRTMSRRSLESGRGRSRSMTDLSYRTGANKENINPNLPKQKLEKTKYIQQWYPDSEEIMSRTTIQHTKNSGSKQKGRTAKKRNNCKCANVTSVNKIRMPILNIHNKFKAKNNQNCAQSIKNKRELIKQIKTTYQERKGTLYKEVAATKDQERRISLVRMWHYIDSTAFLIKQNGNKQEFISLICELENLVAALCIGREQIERWRDADHLSNVTEGFAQGIREAHAKEVILRTERNIRLKQVKNINMQKIIHHAKNPVILRKWLGNSLDFLHKWLKFKTPTYIGIIDKYSDYILKGAKKCNPAINKGETFLHKKINISNMFTMLIITQKKGNSQPLGIFTPISRHDKGIQSTSIKHSNIIPINTQICRIWRTKKQERKTQKMMRIKIVLDPLLSINSRTKSKEKFKKYEGTRSKKNTSNYKLIALRNDPTWETVNLSNQLCKFLYDKLNYEQMCKKHKLNKCNCKILYSKTGTTLPKKYFLKNIQNYAHNFINTCKLSIATKLARHTFIYVPVFTQLFQGSFLHFFLFQNTEHKCNSTHKLRTSKKFSKGKLKQELARSSAVVRTQYIQVKFNDTIHWELHKLNAEISRKNYFFKSYYQITFLKSTQHDTEFILLPVRHGVINFKARQEFFTTYFPQQKKNDYANLTQK